MEGKREKKRRGEGKEMGKCSNILSTMEGVLTCSACANAIGRDEVRWAVEERRKSGQLINEILRLRFLA